MSGLRIAISVRAARQRMQLFVAHHLQVVIAIAAASIFVIVSVTFWHFWVTAIPAKISILARVILSFVQAHPRVSHTFHVFVNMVPDIAYVLLAFAGLSYLMPKLVQKIEKRYLLRTAVTVIFICFAVLAIIVNAVNRTDQEERESQLQRKLDKQGGKLDDLKDQQNNVLTFLVNSKGQPNEAERRRQILETLRGRYVIDHPEVPVSMLTGDSWPPKEWMDKHLRELKETFPFVPPNNAIGAGPMQTPPAIDLDVYVGNDDAERGTFMVDSTKPFRWEEVERACKLPFHCYPERDFKGKNGKSVDIDVGTKGWARMLFSMFNVGGSTLNRPNISINLARGKDVLLSRINQRQPITAASNKINSAVEFTLPETPNIVPISQSHTPFDVAIDVTVDSLVDDFLLGFKIYGDNMSVHFVTVPVHVIRSGS